MTADPVDNATATLAPNSSPTQPKVSDPFDPIGWEVPVLCKDCDKEFKVPYRHFQAGVVFHCPHCHGSYVPTQPMYRRVHETFSSFHTRLRRERDVSLQAGTDEKPIKDKLERELAQFQKQLQQLARELRPAGKMVRRRGLAAMFT